MYELLGLMPGVSFDICEQVLLADAGQRRDSGDI